MTAETPIDNFEATPNEDNAEEIDEQVDDVYGDEEHPSGQAEVTDDDESFWNGNPDELPEELKATYKGMQSAFTKRMQRTSELEKKYFDSIDAANQAVLSRVSEQRAQQAQAEPEAAAPDLANGASPEDVILHYVQQEVQKAFKDSGVDRLAQDMQPVAVREKIVSAYRTFAGDNPNLDHGTLAPLAGKVIDSDPELSALAEINPSAAIRLAARVASAEIKSAATKQKSRKRRQAAPVSARTGTVVKPRRESMLDAATRALKEAGLNPDAF
jgi:hypothetical protein